MTIRGFSNHSNWSSRHLLHVREVETKYLRLAYLGLKGSVAVRLKLYGITICFVNNHLTAHDWNLAKRVEEYNKVIEEMHFKSVYVFGLILIVISIQWKVENTFSGTRRGFCTTTTFSGWAT